MMVGIVRLVEGTSPGPASGISYTVDVDRDGQIVTIPSVIPLYRPPDTIDTSGFLPGTPVVMAASGPEFSQTVYIIAPTEMPDYGCTQ